MGHLLLGAVFLKVARLDPHRGIRWAHILGLWFGYVVAGWGCAPSSWSVWPGSPVQGGMAIAIPVVLGVITIFYLVSQSAWRAPTPDRV